MENNQSKTIKVKDRARILPLIDDEIIYHTLCALKANVKAGKAGDKPMHSETSHGMHGGGGVNTNVRRLLPAFKSCLSSQNRRKSGPLMGINVTLVRNISGFL